MSAGKRTHNEELGDPDRSDREPTSASDESAGRTTTIPAHPRTRQRIHKPPPALAIPSINEDAAERKRVLNVLAQRRYREKRRHARKASEPHPVAPISSILPQEQVEVEDNAVEQIALQPNPSVPSAILQDDVSVQVGADINMAPSFDFGDVPMNLDLDMSGGWQDVSLELIPAPAIPTDPTDSTLPLLDFLQNGEMSTGTSRSSDNAEELSLDRMWPQFDPAFLRGAGSPTFTPTQFPSISPPQSFSSSSSPLISPDSSLLPIHELTLIKAWIRLSARLGVTDAVWELTAQSPFTGLGSDTASHSDLPGMWRPTALQRHHPHHPLVDFIPWPSARDKILQMMRLPDEAKPEAARDPMAFVFLAYDMEDTSEGLRVSGDDPYDAGAWEVGQVMFEKWWFLFDRDIIVQSNRLRRARGASVLRMDSISP